MYVNLIVMLCNGSLVGNGVGSAGACALAKMINSTSLEELWWVLEKTFTAACTCIDDAHDICISGWFDIYALTVVLAFLHPLSTLLFPVKGWQKTV